MANIRQYYAQYLGPFSTVETFHMGGGTPPGFGQFPAFPNAGALGVRVEVTQTGVGSKEYQLCQIDSGATSATPTGAIALGQLMYWKNRQTYLVTNDVRFSDWFSGGTRPGVNSVAGVLVTPTTGAVGTVAVPGDVVYLQTKGNCRTILSAQASPTIGDWAIPNNSATVPQINSVALGTAPVDTVVGRYTSSTVAASIAQVDLQLPEIP